MGDPPQPPPAGRERVNRLRCRLDRPITDGMSWLAVLCLAFFPGPLAWEAAPRETLEITVSGAPGDRPPVILIPGLLGSAFGYRRLIPLLNDAGFQTVVIEPLGVGRSGRPAGSDYSLTAQSDRIAAAMRDLGTGPGILLAHGIGASKAYRLAVRHPELVAGIVSLDGGPAETAATPGLGSAMKFAPLARLLAGDDAIRDRLKEQLARASGDDSWITDEVVRNYTAGITRDFGAATAAFQAMAASVEPEALGPRLADIHAPVELLLGGALHDYAVPRAEIEQLRRLPALQVVVVPGAGHYLQEERPDAVLMAVRRLYRRIEEEPALGQR